MRKSYTYAKNIEEKRKKKISKNKTKNNNKLKTLLTFALFIVLMVLLTMSSLFNISVIRVYGVEHCSNEEIVKASEIKIGVNGFKNIGGSIKNFFFFRYGQAETNILNRCPYVKDIVVRYNPPNKVYIHVMERKPFVLIPYIGTFLVVDREGFVLETIDSKEKVSLPYVKGIKFSNYEIGQAVKIENIEYFEKLIILLDALTEEEKDDKFKLIDNIDTIDISDVNNIYMLIDSRLVVNIGDTFNLNYRIRTLKQILYKYIGNDETGMLDFTTGDYPVFIPSD